MSKYTTEVRYICETAYGLKESKGYDNVQYILESTWREIFDFDFPIFDEAYRAPLCIKILRHFYTREIGDETVGLWKLRLADKMNTIMPYYNELYKAWAIEFNPLWDTDLQTVHKLDKNQGLLGSTDTETESDATNRNLYSDTPQGALNGVESETYLTNARKVTDKENATSHSDVKQYLASTDDYIEHIVGKSPGQSFSKQLSDFRNALINIDAMVIADLENLFMLIW